MPVTVRQVSVSSEPETPYFLRLAWEGRDLGSGFQVMLTDGQSVWDGEVGEDAVTKEAAELEVKKERYIQDLNQALAGEGRCDPGYSFTLTPSPSPSPSSSRTLAYEKVESDIWIKLGSVSLKAHPEPLQEVRAMLAHFLEQTATLENHNRKLKEENHRFRQEQQHITAEMKRYAAQKESLEAELYGRFVLVLNEKKAKIRSLQGSIASLQEHSSPAEGKEAGSKTSGRASDHEDDDYGCSTDDEPEDASETGPAPATSAANTGSPSCSPLADGPDDLPDIAPCRKRRFRHLRPPDAVAKKPTPATAPAQRRDSPATSRRTANRQQAPQCSSDAMATSRDTEDLFEDF